MEGKKIELICKLQELEEVISDSNVMIQEYDDISSIVSRAHSIINGRLDEFNYVVRDNQIEQCLNALSNLILKFKSRTK